MANPTPTTARPHAVTFSADELTGKTGTLRFISGDENGDMYGVSYTDDAGGNRVIWLKAADITLSA